VTLKRITVTAPAKINLILEIQGRRPDGYHELKTVMHTLELADRVAIRETREPGIRVTCDHPDVPQGEGNLVYKAAGKLAEACGRKPAVHLHITKRIPMAAGMGGGSSDAAAALLGLARLWQWDHPRKLASIAGELGSDVPFLLRGGCCFGTGRGDRLISWPEAPGLPILVVNPGFPVSTATVYKNVSLALTTQKAYINMMRQALVEKNVEKISKYLLNHLETVTERMHPVIAAIKKKLLEHGALAAMMSGSGPTVFGLVPSFAVGKKIQARLSGEYPTVLLTRTSSHLFREGEV